ncbi:MAG TPA: hypothetical protein VI814_01905 [Candidatus Limnocylindria bacterium]
MLTSVLLAALALVVIAIVVGALIVAISVLVYGPSGAGEGLGAFLHGRFRKDRRPWWDFFGFTDESDVIYPLMRREGDGDAENGRNDL